MVKFKDDQFAAGVKVPAQALYLKWRPRQFEHVIGQGHITRALRNALIQDRIRHAYLFNGPRGTGKTTMARMLAKAINCQHPDPAARPCDECEHCVAIQEGRFLDMIEIDAASYNSVDDVRDLRDKIAFAPSEGPFKVYIIDEVHRFSGAAFDALLKTLEEPPDHTIFILATTELDKVPATIKSRSLIFEFHRVSLSEVADRLQLIAETEGVQIDRDVLELVAQQGTGSVRDSISLLDQLIVDVNERITMEMAEQVLGTAGNRYVGRLVQAVIENNAARGLELLNQAIDEGADPAQFGRQIVDYLRNIMLAQTAGPDLLEVSAERKLMFAEQAAKIGRSALVRAIKEFNAAVSEVRKGWQPQLPLELALVQSTRPLQEEPTVTVTRVVQEIAAAPNTTITTVAETATASLTDSSSGDLDVPLVSSISFTEITAQWSAILELMRRKYMPLVKILEKATVKSLNGNTLNIVVTSAALKAKVQNEQNVIRAAIQRVTGFMPEAVRVLVAEEVHRQIAATIDDDPLMRGILNDHPSQITNVEDSHGGF
ncbi:MAG: DNA polymerase III subunit gamma/tau [Anaerolineae bacterium]|nr:DNA polymerase III subunit gamma/tau [Anaerolineae bacterium]